MMKRVFAAFLCLVLVASVLPVNMARAATDEGKAQQKTAQIVASQEGTVVKSDDGNISITKTATPTGIENYFDVTLTVTDRDIVDETSTDIVLVMDISNTMTDKTAEGTTRFENARAAAAAFVQHYFADPDLGSQRRLGLVTFNTDAKVEIQLEQVSRATMTHIQNMTLTKDNNNPKRFTNIEGGLRQAQAMLERSNAAHKFIILITDGFPTTYTQKTDSDGTLIGYDTYDPNGKIFKDRQWNKPCSYGTSYSDEAARRAQNWAETIRNDEHINIVSIGIDIGGQTIQGYLDGRENKDFSIVDRPKGVHPNGYVIGSATSTDSYINWLRDAIGGFVDADIDAGAETYYNGDSASELTAAFDAILDTVASTTHRAMSDPLVVDPMGSGIEFLGFYKKDGSLTGNQLDGTHTVGG